jgi:hypothetical protein
MAKEPVQAIDLLIAILDNHRRFTQLPISSQSTFMDWLAVIALELANVESVQPLKFQITQRHDDNSSTYILTKTEAST